jgi:MraZ protein
MIIFQGEFECKIDAKYRTVLPAKLKACLPENENSQIVITRSQEPCLTIFPTSVWEGIYQKVISLNMFSEEYKKFQRTFLRGATTLDLDGQGRFIVPKLMAQDTQLENDFIMVGIGERIEVWNPVLYEKYLISDPAEFSKMTEKILGDKKPYSFDLNLFKN